MTKKSAKITTPNNPWEVLMRLKMCSKTELAAELDGTRQTLANWIKGLRAGRLTSPRDMAKTRKLLDKTLKNSQLEQFTSTPFRENKKQRTVHMPSENDGAALRINIPEVNPLH